MALSGKSPYGNYQYVLQMPNLSGEGSEEQALTEDSKQSVELQLPFPSYRPEYPREDCAVCRGGKKMRATSTRHHIHCEDNKTHSDKDN